MLRTWPALSRSPPGAISDVPAANITGRASCPASSWIFCCMLALGVWSIFRGRASFSALHAPAARLLKIAGVWEFSEVRRTENSLALSSAAGAPPVDPPEEPPLLPPPQAARRIGTAQTDVRAARVRLRLERVTLVLLCLRGWVGRERPGWVGRERPVWVGRERPGWVGREEELAE